MMSILLNLATKQVDYVAAFVQADIDTTVYVEMPRGFTQQGKVLRLKKSLYGLSPRNHFHNLSAKLQTLASPPVIQIPASLYPTLVSVWCMWMT
jgi:hypothetical protein